MSPVFHREATATEPDAVTALFHEIGVRFSFDPTVPGFSYRQRQDGDGQVTVVGLDLGGPFSSWGDTDVFGVADVRAASRYDWRASDESGSGLGRPVLFRPGHPALIVGGALEVTNVNLAAALLQAVAVTVHGTEGRLWRIRAGRIVLATGATERPIVFAGNDRPGILLASAAATYIRFRLALAWMGNSTSWK